MKKIIQLIITLLLSLLGLQAQLSWQAEKVNEVNWFAPVAVFDYQGDIYVLGDNKTENNRDSLLLYRYDNGSFEYDKSIFSDNPFPTKFNIFSYTDGAVLRQSNSPIFVTLLGENKYYEYANENYLIIDSLVSTDGGLTFTQSPIKKPIYINNEIIVGKAFSDSLFVFRKATSLIDTVVGYSSFVIDFMDDGIIVDDEGHQLWINSNQNVEIEGDPFLLASIDDFIAIDDKLYYHIANHIYEYRSNAEDKIVYSFLNNNSLNDQNTRHQSQTFVQKDKYIYFYDSYKGLVKISDFTDFEYLGAIINSEDILLYSVGDNVLAYGEGQMWKGQRPENIYPIEGSTPDTKILYYDEEKVWFADYRINYQGWAPGIYFSKYQPKINPDTLERYQYVYLFYSDSNYAIGQNRLYGSGFSILDYQNSTFLPLTNSEEKLIHIDPITLPYNGSTIFYHDTLFIGYYHSVNKKHNEMKRIESVYDKNGTEVKLGYYDVLRYEISNDSLFAYHRDSTWYTWENGVFREYSKTKEPIVYEEYLVVNNLQPKSKTTFNINDDSLTINSKDYHPMAFPQKPHSFLQHDGNYYFSSKNEIYKLYLVPTSVEEKWTAPHAFPNPTTGPITLGQRYDWLELYSADGRLLRGYSNTDSIDLSGLPAGAYLLSTGNGIFQKIILE